MAARRAQDYPSVSFLSLPAAWPGWSVAAQLMQTLHDLGYDDRAIRGVHIGRGGQPQLVRFNHICYAGQFMARLGVATYASHAFGFPWRAKLLYPWPAGSAGRSGSAAPAGSRGAPPTGFAEVRAGDWLCRCGQPNYASRFRCSSCHADATHSTVRRVPLGPRPWHCPHTDECGAVNEEDAHSCFLCNKLRPVDATGNAAVGLLTPDLALPPPPLPPAAAGRRAPGAHWSAGPLTGRPGGAH